MARGGSGLFRKVTAVVRALGAGAAFDSVGSDVLKKLSAPVGGESVHQPLGGAVGVVETLEEDALGGAEVRERGFEARDALRALLPGRQHERRLPLSDGPPLCDCVKLRLFAPRRLLRLPE